MKIGYCIGLIVFIMMFTTIIGNTHLVNGSSRSQPPVNHIIKVATHNSTQLFGSGWGLMKVHKRNLNYSWIVDNDRYFFQTNETNTSILMDYNKLSQYDVFLMSGMHDEHVWCGQYPRIDGHVQASDLTHNESSYRVYAMFGDPDDKVLRTDDGVELVAWWQFSVT
jgi:hypothetical protein